MTTTHQDHVKSSLTWIFQNKSRLRENFYAEFFARMPETKSLFSGDRAHMNAMFERFLVDVLSAIGQKSGVEPQIRNFIRFHRSLKLSSDHFDACEASLVSMFENGIKGTDSLSDETIMVWQSLARQLVQQFRSAYLASPDG